MTSKLTFAALCLLLLDGCSRSEDASAHAQEKTLGGPVRVAQADEPVVQANEPLVVPTETITASAPPEADDLSDEEYEGQHWHDRYVKDSCKRCPECCVKEPGLADTETPTVAEKPAEAKKPAEKKKAGPTYQAQKKVVVEQKKAAKRAFKKGSDLDHKTDDLALEIRKRRWLRLNAFAQARGWSQEKPPAGADKDPQLLEWWTEWRQLKKEMDLVGPPAPKEPVQ